MKPFIKYRSDVFCTWLCNLCIVKATGCKSIIIIILFFRNTRTRCLGLSWLFYSLTSPVSLYISPHTVVESWVNFCSVMFCCMWDVLKCICFRYWIQKKKNISMSNYNLRSNKVSLRSKVAYDPTTALKCFWFGYLLMT